MYLQKKEAKQKRQYELSFIKGQTGIEGEESLPKPDSATF